MQNYIKSQTRLAFVQYIFQNEFISTDSFESIEDFQKHFYDTNIAIIDEKKEFKPVSYTHLTLPTNSNV